MFSKVFANFRAFSPSFSKFLFGGFGEFQRLKGQKICRQGFSVFSKFLSPAAEEIFAQGTPAAGRWADGRGVPDVKQLKCTLSQILKNRKIFVTLVVAGPPSLLAPRLALFGRLADGAPQPLSHWERGRGEGMQTC